MEPCVAGSLWSRSEPRATRHVVSHPDLLILPTNAGLGGSCCRLASCCWRLFEGLIPELSFVFWATGPICGQASLSTADRSPDPAFELGEAVFLSWGSDYPCLDPFSL